MPKSTRGKRLGRDLIHPAVGDLILVGAPHEPHRQVLDLSYVRAIGTVEELGEFQRRCRAEVHELQAAVLDAESALRRARNAVWSALDRMAMERTDA